jgi:hypothetical protein
MDQRTDAPVTQLADGSGPTDVEYHPGTETYRLRFDGRERATTDAVLTAVAACRERDELALPPLYSVVDPDALDALFTTAAGDESPRTGTVAFDYAGCRVTVERRGTVVVEPTDADEGGER